MKQLTRATDDRMVAGICGGLGKYFNIDPTMVRIIVVILMFASFGAVLLGYFIGTLIIPNETERY